MKDLFRGPEDENVPSLLAPSTYRVVLLHDDYTCVKFAVALLMQVFAQPLPVALALAAQVHDTGRAVAGTYTAEAAETKVWLANTVARHEGHPLMFVMEKR